MKKIILSPHSAFCRPHRSASPGDPAETVVSILVDQLRYDYLERFHDQFTRRLSSLLTGQGAFNFRTL